MDFPAQRDHSGMIHYCEQQTVVLVELFNVLFTFSLSLIQVLRLIISEAIQEVV